MEKPVFSVICHCTICQRKHGACMSHFVAVKPDELRLISGLDKLKGFHASESMKRFHCSECGTPVYSESLIPDFPFRDFCSTILDRDDQNEIKGFETIKPTEHIFYRSKVFRIRDGLPKYQTFRFNKVQLDDDGNPIPESENIHSEMKLAPNNPEHQD